MRKEEMLTMLFREDLETRLWIYNELHKEILEEILLLRCEESEEHEMLKLIETISKHNNGKSGDDLFTIHNLCNDTLESIKESRRR